MNIDELAWGKGTDVKAVLDHCKTMRTVHRFHTRGWSKKKTLMEVGQIPISVWLHPEFKDRCFSDEADAHERRKNYEWFFKKYPQFKTRD